MSIPNFLAGSIFSAEKGNAILFHKNARLLVILCFTSGICRFVFLLMGELNSELISVVLKYSRQY